MADSVWSVDFWLDPACPLTRHTARWITSIIDEVPLEVRWRVMSLSVLNEDRDDDPEDDPDGYLWIPCRVAMAVQASHGHAALGTFYDALWTDPDGTEREWLGDLASALYRTGLPPELADVGTSTDYDEPLRASHLEGVSLVEAEVGTPIFAVTSPDGVQQAFFGPVLSSAPEATDAMRLWNGTVLLSGIPAFREFKR